MTETIPTIVTVAKISSSEKAPLGQLSVGSAMSGYSSSKSWLNSVSPVGVSESRLVTGVHRSDHIEHRQVDRKQDAADHACQ